MKAAQIINYGGKDVMQITENADKPMLKPDQVLVEVYAASVNPFDIKVREGAVSQMAELTFPATLGGDVAGVVAELGPEVSGFEVGEAVYGQAHALSGQGSFAEFSPVKAESLAPKPTTVDFDIAASLPLASVSAYQALTTHMNLQSGQKVLIHGGGGGIGTLAIQLAKHLGAFVATTATAADADFLRGLGADEVVDYQNQDFSESIKDYDGVFDTVGGDTNLKSYRVLKKGGALVSMVQAVDENLAKEYDVHYTYQFTQVTTERLTAIAELVDDGTLKPIVAKVFTLDDAAEAMEYAKTGHPRGKVVIEVKTA